AHWSHAYLGMPLIPGSWLLGSLAVAAVTGIAVAIWALRSARDPLSVARRIEAKYPGLDTGLLAAVEQTTETPSGQLGYLQTVVVRHALQHRQSHDWGEAVPTRVLRGAMLSHALAILGFLAVFAMLVAGTYFQGRGSKADVLVAAGDDIQVEPGDTELERGT